MTTSPDNPGWAAWRHHFDDAMVSYTRALLSFSSCNGTSELHFACRGADCDTSLEELSYVAEDFAPGAAREMEEDLQGFVTSCLSERPNAFAGMDAGMVGEDFYLSRNGHGSGFWDRGFGERGQWLTTMAKSFGSQGACVGDDGSLYVHG